MIIYRQRRSRFTCCLCVSLWSWMCKILLSLYWNADNQRLK